MTTLTDESHEMWKIDELGVACWVFGESICSFDLRGGDSNLSFRPRQSSGVTASDQADPLGLSITSIESQSLPSAAEQFQIMEQVSAHKRQHYRYLSCALDGIQTFQHIRMVEHG